MHKNGVTGEIFLLEIKIFFTVLIFHFQHRIFYLHCVWCVGSYVTDSNYRVGSYVTDSNYRVGSYVTDSNYRVGSYVTDSNYRVGSYVTDSNYRVVLQDELNGVKFDEFPDTTVADREVVEQLEGLVGYDTTGRPTLEVCHSGGRDTQSEEMIGRGGRVYTTMSSLFALLTYVIKSC